MPFDHLSADPAFDIAIVVLAGERRITLSFTSHAPITALVGRSGVGKTSILNAMAGLLTPREGHIRAAGRTLFDAGAGIDLSPDRRGTGYVFQDMRLFPHMRVAANLAYGVRHGRRALDAGSDTFPNQDAIIEHLALDRLMDRWPATLSGGERQRVALARALLSRPSFLLLDEPLNAVDPGRVDAIIDMIRLCQRAACIPMLIVSHSAQHIARLTDEVVTMDEPDSGNGAA